MYEGLKDFDLDEFWDDCMEKPFIKNNNKKRFHLKNSSSDYNINNSNSFQKINPNKNKLKFVLRKRFPKYILNNDNEPDFLKSKLILNTQSSQYELKNIKQALIKEELIPILKYKKQEKTNKIFLDIYNRDKLGKELWAKNNSTKKEKLEKSNVRECTFKPEKSKNKKLEKKINNLYKNSNIYERNLKYQQKKNEKIAFLFNETNKICNNFTNSECYFHPYINNNKNIEKILYDQNNIWKNQADNDSNKLFLLRYMKAREEVYDKKERLNSPSNKNLSNNYTYPKKMIRSISLKDSLIMRKNLHNTLYSFKNLFTEDDDDDNNAIINNEENKEDKEDNDNINIEKGKKIEKLDNFQWTFAKKNNN